VNVCRSCGHENSDDAQFCEACQDYLWTKREGIEEQRPAAAAEPPVDGAAADAPLGRSGADGADRSPAEAQPVAVKPAREFEPPLPELPEFHEPEPGELICDQCGSGNRAVANFCRRCGAPLAGAHVADRPSWWRRLIPRRDRTYAAGERRRRTATPKTAAQKARRGLFHVSRTLGILAALGVVSIAAWRGDVVDRVGDAAHDLISAIFPHYEPAIPNDVSATSHLRNHRAAAAFDKNTSSYWAESAPGDGKGQKLVARYHRLVDLGRVGFTLGDQSAPQNFVKEPVPRDVRLVFFDRYGRRVGKKVLHLAQEPDFQRFSIEADNVTKVVLTILSVFHSRIGHDASIAEVEFFEKT
jgi:ribosomal protein L40E